MSQNSLFAILLRSRWWISLVVALGLGVVGAALMPEQFRVVGALSGLPFFVISGIALWRQRDAPSPARVEAVEQAVGTMAWPAFAALLEQAFRRDGHVVQRAEGGAVDFVLERAGRRRVVAARRWKSARTGVEPLRALQAARETAEATEAVWIGLAGLSDNARPYAAEHGIEVWRAAELARHLRGLPLRAPEH